MRMRRVLGMALLAALMALAVSGCAGGTTSGGGAGGGEGDSGGKSAGATITERNTAFTPSSLEVGVGETVTFVNEDAAPHNVSIDGVELGTQNQGDSVTWTAESAGTYTYSCTIHPSMTGEIVVK